MKIGVVVLDTLRYDVATDEMDSLWELSDHIFEKMYSTSRWTVGSHASLFTGLYPSESGTHNSDRYLTLDKPTLAERLSEIGYKTHLYSNNPYVDSFFHFDRGFKTHHRGPACKGRPEQRITNINWSDLFIQLEESKFRNLRAIYELIKRDTPMMPALREGIKMKLRPQTTEATLETNDVGWFFSKVEKENLESPDNSFFYINLMPCHYPYNPPDEYRDVKPYNDVDPQKLYMNMDVTDEQKKRQWECYQGTARYIDDQLERIIRLCDWDALFIISDHGELFGEYDLRLHNYGVYEELIHVPAVALGNKIPSGHTESLTSLLDIHNTLLNLAGAGSIKSDRGINLFGKQSRDYVYAESTGVENPHSPPDWDKHYYSLITPRGKIIDDKDGLRLKSIGTGIDYSTAKQELQNKVNNLRSQWAIKDTEDQSSSVPENVDNRLSALGYK